MGTQAQGIALEEYDRLIGLIYRAGLDSSLWPDVVNEIDRQLDGAHMALYGYDTRSGTALDTITTGYSPDQLASYAAYYHRRNPFIATLSAAPVMHISTIDDHIARPDFLRTEFLNDFLAAEEPVGAGAGGTLLRDEGRMLVLCGHVRFRDEDTKVPRLLHLIELLGPHVARAFGIARRLGGQSLAVTTCEEVLDRLGNSVFVLDAAGRPLFANAAARARMQDSDAIGLSRDGALQFRTLSTQQAFQSGFARLLKSDDIRLPGQFLVELAPDDFVAATLDPFRDDTQQPGPWNAPAVALLSLADHALDQDRTEQRLRALYGLTAAERRLVLHLARDRSIGEVADLTGLSPHTLRSQLKSVYAKTGQNRQAGVAGLVHRMASRL
ncbi:MAG: hypothetical protein CML68_18835 [Rhodobacteraceae bacterium]|nr:hypothetical protein [Paracoccaceae bacterium]